MPAAATLHQSKAVVQNVYPEAVCKHDETHRGAGISWAIYDRAKPTSERRRITGGWMTPAQAWDQAAKRVTRKRIQTVADLERELRRWNLDCQLVIVDSDGARRDVRTIVCSGTSTELCVELKP
jgi:hypothetical protein